MKKIFILSQILFSVLISTQTFSATLHTLSPIQQIYVSNVLWNPNATGAAQGLTPTAVTVAFNNGGTRPCYSTTLAFQGAITILVGTGQICVAAVTSVSITPIAGVAGTVFAAPTDTSIDGSYYSSQILLTDGTDPVFDTTNGAIKTQGVVSVSMQGS